MTNSAFPGVAQRTKYGSNKIQTCTCGFLLATTSLLHDCLA